MSRALIAMTGGLFLALIVSVASLSAQDYRAKLQGIVRDSSQAVVVGAKRQSIEDDYYRHHYKRKKAKKIKISVRFELPPQFTFRRDLQAVSLFLG